MKYKRIFDLESHRDFFWMQYYHLTKKRPLGYTGSPFFFDIRTKIMIHIVTLSGPEYGELFMYDRFHIFAILLGVFSSSFSAANHMPDNTYNNAENYAHIQILFLKIS